jgi:multidrug efflux system membrane fusion protein
MFKEGDYVKEGQPLAQIDPRPFQVQLAQAEGQLAHDEALLTDAKLDLERYRTLLAQDAIPKQQLDTQVATVGQYEGSIKQDQANIDNAKLQLVYAKITAPISGRIGLRLVDPGNIVHASDTTGMLVITQLQPITAIFTIPEDSLPQVLKKLHAGVRLPLQAWNRDRSKELSDGYLLTVDNQIDPTTGTSRLKAVFANKDFQLFPNQFVNIRLLVDTLRNQIVIPTVAIQRGQQGPFVYTVSEDGTAHMQAVQTGITEGNNTSIRAGLNGGEQVVIDGFDRLADKAKVRIRPAMPSATITPTGLTLPPEDNSAGPAQGHETGGHGRAQSGHRKTSTPPGEGTRTVREGLREGNKQ